MSEIEGFLSAEEEQKVIEAIRVAENETSGEIRVHIENDSNKYCMDHAKEIFHLLHMDETKEKNGVLFYVAVHAQQFAIIGDRGINDKVPDNFWNDIKNIVTGEFSKGNKANGLVMGILAAGKKLQQYFPYRQKDSNELSDEISIGKKNNKN